MSKRNLRWRVMWWAWLLLGQSSLAYSVVSRDLGYSFLAIVCAANCVVLAYAIAQERT